MLERLHLHTGELFAINQKVKAITCLEGHIWITHPNSTDIVLKKGEKEVSLYSDKVLVEAFSKSVVEFC